MTVKVWKQAKVTHFKSGNYRLSTCGQSAIMSTYDDNNEIMEFMRVPKEILDAYAENYLAENFELTENDGWVRILKGEEIKMKVKYKKWNCIVQWSMYFENNNIAIQLVDEKTKESISMATTNTGRRNIESTVQIKDYSENEGMWQALVDAGVIKDKIVNTIPTGYVEVKVAELTEEAKKDFENWLEEWFF